MSIMNKDKDSIFEEYEDLYKLTSKTVDAHIEFYKKKETISEGELFTIWNKLSQQAENFDKRNWTENWYNWHKNLQAFEKHKFEVKFLIQHFLTDVLEQLIVKIIHKYEKSLKLIDNGVKQSSVVELSEMIKKEIKRQIKQELSNQKRKARKKITK